MAAAHQVPCLSRAVPVLPAGGLAGKDMLISRVCPTRTNRTLHGARRDCAFLSSTLPYLSSSTISRLSIVLSIEVVEFTRVKISTKGGASASWGTSGLLRDALVRKF